MLVPNFVLPPQTIVVSRLSLLFFLEKIIYVVGFVRASTSFEIVVVWVGTCWFFITCSLHVLGLISGLEMEVLLVPWPTPFMSWYGNLRRISCGVRLRHKVFVTLKVENHFCLEACIYNNFWTKNACVGRNERSNGNDHGGRAFCGRGLAQNWDNLWNQTRIVDLAMYPGLSHLTYCSCTTTNGV